MTGFTSLSVNRHCGLTCKHGMTHQEQQRMVWVGRSGGGVREGFGRQAEEIIGEGSGHNAPGQLGRDAGGGSATRGLPQDVSCVRQRSGLSNTLGPFHARVKCMLGVSPLNGLRRTGVVEAWRGCSMCGGKVGGVGTACAGARQQWSR